MQLHHAQRGPHDQCRVTNAGLAQHENGADVGVLETIPQTCAPWRPAEKGPAVQELERKPGGS